MRSVILLGVTLALCAPLGALAQKAPGHAMEAAEESFRQQHYQDTVSMVRALLAKDSERSVRLLVDLFAVDSPLFRDGRGQRC